MGTLIGNPQKRASFQQQLFPAGLDLNRCEIHRALGVWKANASTSFRAGQAVMLNSDGELVVSDATSVLGVAKWNKITQKRTVYSDVPILFGTAGATKNLKPNIVTGSVRVASAVLGGGTVYTLTTHYTLNLTNGTITHVDGGGGFIDEAANVYVSYARTLTEDDLQLEGKNFWQSLDDSTIQDGRMTVIEAPAQIFTTEFDTAVNFALTGATSNVYVNSSGMFTSTIGSNKLVGRCINVPSAGDPFLGVNFFGQVAVNT